MQILAERRVAKILPFSIPAVRSNRLTVADRIQALEWNESHAAPVGARLTIHDRHSDDTPEVSDYLSIYRADDRWAVWCAARDASGITVWHGPSGSDLGSFATMQEALAAVTAASIQPRLGKNRNRRQV